MFTWPIIPAGLLIGIVLALFAVRADSNARYNKMFDVAANSKQASSKAQFEKEYRRKKEGLFRPAVPALLASVFIWSFLAGALSTSVLGTSKFEQYDLRTANLTLGLLIAWFSWIGAWRIALKVLDTIFQKTLTKTLHFTTLVWALVIPFSLAAILIVRVVQG